MMDQSPYASPAPITSDEQFIAERVLPRPWGFWATLGWGVLIGIAWLVVQTAVIIVTVVVMVAVTPQLDFAEVVAQSGSNGLVISVATLATAPVAFVACGLAAYLRGWPVLEYLGVTRFRHRHLWIGVAALAVVLPIMDLSTYLSGRPIVPEFMVEAYRTAGFLPLLVLALVVGAPLGEELLFRGFLYRGWAASWLGPVGATLLISLLWAMIHLQYDWFGISQIFFGGLLLGWLRWLSGSTTVCIVMHAIMNLVATIEAVVQIELLS